jgi:hypothetical protein
MIIFNLIVFFNVKVSLFFFIFSPLCVFFSGFLISITNFYYLYEKCFFSPDYMTSVRLINNVVYGISKEGKVQVIFTLG